jgi:hypothetical protein
LSRIDFAYPLPAPVLVILNESVKVSAFAEMFGNVQGKRSYYRQIICGPCLADGSCFDFSDF